MFAPLLKLPALKEICLTAEDISEDIRRFLVHSSAQSAIGLRIFWSGAARLVPLHLPAFLLSLPFQQLAQVCHMYPPTQWTAEQVFRLLTSLRSRSRASLDVYSRNLNLIVSLGLDLGLVQRNRPTLLTLLELVPSVELLKTLLLEPLIEDPTNKGRMLTPLQNLQRVYPGFRISMYDTLYAAIMTSVGTEDTTVLDCIKWLKENASAIAEASQDPDLVGNAHTRDSTGAFPHQRRYSIYPELMLYLIEHENVEPDETFLRAQFERPYNLGLVLRSKPQFLSILNDQNNRYVFASVLVGLHLAKPTMSATFKMLDVIGSILDAVEADQSLRKYIMDRSVEVVIHGVLHELFFGKEDSFGERQLEIWNQLRRLCLPDQQPNPAMFK
jgi:hypothetical protein